MKLNNNNITQVPVSIPMVKQTIDKIINIVPTRFNAMYVEYVECQPKNATHYAIIFKNEDGLKCSILIAKTEENQVLFADLI